MHGYIIDILVIPCSDVMAIAQYYYNGSLYNEVCIVCVIMKYQMKSLKTKDAIAEDSILCQNLE